VADRENCHIPHRYPIARKRGEDVVILDLLGLMHDYAVRGELSGEDEADWDGPGKKAAEKAELKARKENLDTEVDVLMDRMEPNVGEWLAKVEDVTSIADLEALFIQVQAADLGNPAEKKLFDAMDKRAAKLRENA
jgi:hypothetical protein